MRGVAPGERRGAGKKTMLGSYGRTICPVPGGHRVSVSWEGGSLATKADAEAADAYWQELRDSLGEPLNLGKWQQCRQSDHDMVCELGGSYVDGAAATGAGAATSTAPRPPVPSSADAVFLQEEMSAFFSLTRDASPHGWAAVVRWWDEVDGHMALLVVGSWPDGGDVTEQPNRECLAAPLALEAAAAAGCKGVVCAPPERRGGGCAKGARSQGLCSAVRFGACG